MDGTDVVAKELLASLEQLTEEQIAALPPDRLKELIDAMQNAKKVAMAELTRRRKQAGESIPEDKILY